MTVETNHTLRDTDRIATYCELLRAVPGLGETYHLVAALINSAATNDARVLLVGAGGGREIAALTACKYAPALTALDPNAQYLHVAKRVAREAGLSGSVRFIEGVIDDLPLAPRYDMATALLVMQNIADDGSKLSFLRSIRSRLSKPGLLVLADVCIDGQAEHERMVAMYRSHAAIAGIAEDTVNIELAALAHLPIISSRRTLALLSEAGFGHAQEVFRSLWYRCWVVDSARGELNEIRG